MSIQHISFLHEMSWSSQLDITFEPCVLWHWKKSKWKEFNLLSFAQNSFNFADAKPCIYGHFTGATKIKSTWTSYIVKLICFCPIYMQKCPVLMHGFENFGGSYTNLKKTMTTFVGCVSYDKIQNSISKGQLLPITHNIQI